MKKIFFLLLLLLPGCSELVQYGGILINSINDNCYTAIIYISISNTNNIQLSNFNICVIRDNDLLCISDRKISGSNRVTRISFPEELISPITSETKFITVIAEHPYIGSFHQNILLDDLNKNSPIYIDFCAGEIPDTLSPLPQNYFRQFIYRPY